MPARPLVTEAVTARMLQQGVTAQQATVLLLLEEHLTTASVDPQKKPCAVCRTPTSFSCPTCHGVYYCSPSHQTQDLPSHSLVCSPTKDIPLQPPSVLSSSTWIAVLVMPEYSAVPYYQWAECILNRHSKPVFDQTPFFGGNNRSKPLWIFNHPVTRQELKYPIMGYKARIADTGSPGAATPSAPTADVTGENTINLCIYNATNGKHRVCGNMIFFTAGRELNPPSRGGGMREWLMSFKPEDIQIVVEQLKLSARENLPPSTTGLATSDNKKRKDNEKIRAVVVYPIAVDDGKNSPESVKEIVFEGLDIPANHPIFNEAYGTHNENQRLHQPTFADTYGFPIRTFMFSSSAYRGVKGNTLIRDLYPTVETIVPAGDEGKGGLLGGYPVVKKYGWNAEDIGAVLIARKDRKGVEVQHVQAFREFCKYLEKKWARYAVFREKKVERKEKYGYREWTLEDEGEILIIDRMYGSLNKSAFSEFWQERYGGKDLVGPFDDTEEREDGEDHDEEEEDEGGDGTGTVVW
ncbi:hypothetical protein H072_2550 [Dactylellina haptotyla CBS 200.50]|uniref:MYND-type domain-containing protein n=1 Tax=Dactylellina haptotyla (strain CBS 200.50) TaxID=1284197 RepID=S8AKP4_DACHA|nr:hypothetical protein H072_2550 [Dactylellina haptotyla CBS 200.50]